MVDLMCSDLTFCQFFFNKETRKLMANRLLVYEPMDRKQALTKHHIGQDLVLSHLDVTDGDTQAKNLFQLELDCRTDLSELV